MEFGKVTSLEVKSTDFSLPKDGQQTEKILQGAVADTLTANVFVGCAKWGLPEWVGFLYPPKTKSSAFLEEYARHFNSIELNAAHYKIPSLETARKWKKQALANAPGRFLFCPKFPVSITHYKRLKGAESTTDEFLTAIVQFEETLGPCFLQLSDSFGPDNLAVLENYLKLLPLDLSVFVELRNEEWFSDPLIRKEVFEMLSRLKKGAVITDVGGRRDVLHMELTIPEIFIRFVGSGSPHRKSDLARIDAWAERIKEWQDKGLQKVYFFLHQHDERESVELAAYTVKVFNKTLGSKIPEIILQASLF